MTTYSLSKTQWKRWQFFQTPIIVHYSKPPYKMTACNQKAYYIITKAKPEDGFELCGRCAQIIYG